MRTYWWHTDQNLTGQEEALKSHVRRFAVERMRPAADATWIRNSIQRKPIMLLLTGDDFRIKAENFDLTKGANILRIAAGAFMFPHIAGKFAAGLALNAGTVGFFAKAGFSPAEFWVYLAAVSEFLVGVFLVLGLCTRYAAVGGVAVLGVAVYALQTVKGFGWTWNTGGYEFPVFWAIVCAAIAIEEWKTALAADRRPARPAVASKLAP